MLIKALYRSDGKRIEVTDDVIQSFAGEIPEVRFVFRR